MMVASVAVPTAPPRLRSMLNTPEAAPTCPSERCLPWRCAASGAITRAWPMARTMFGMNNWSPLSSRLRCVFMKQLAANSASPVQTTRRGVETLHQQRHQRDQQQAAAGRSRPAPCRSARHCSPAPGRDRPAGYRPSRTARSRRGRWRRCPSAKLRRVSSRRLTQRLLHRQLDDDEERQRDRSHDRQPDDEGRAEPVVLVAFLEHGLQRSQADRHGGDAHPVALAQQGELHLAAFERGQQQRRTSPRRGSRLTKKMYCQP